MVMMMLAKGILDVHGPVLPTGAASAGERIQLAESKQRERHATGHRRPPVHDRQVPASLHGGNDWSSAQNGIKGNPRRTGDGWRSCGVQLCDVLVSHHLIINTALERLYHKVRATCATKMHSSVMRCAFVFVSPPPLGRCRMYSVFWLSVRPSVRAWSNTESLFARCLINRLWESHQIYNFGPVWHRGQNVKGRRSRSVGHRQHFPKMHFFGGSYPSTVINRVKCNIIHYDSRFITVTLFMLHFSDRYYVVVNPSVYCFYAIYYLCHPLKFTENFTDIVPDPH